MSSEWIVSPESIGFLEKECAMIVMRKLYSRAAMPLVSLAVFFGSVLVASAGELTAQDIVAKLKPPSTRSFGVGSGLCTRDTRAIVRTADDTQTRRTVELTIPFAYNSDRLSPEAEKLLDAVGRALTDEQLSCHDFMLAGHTDAVGGANYNLSLSERRALAVQFYLSKKFGLPAQRLEARGFGKERLLDPQDPTAAVNRRVELVNLTGAQ